MRLVSHERYWGDSALSTEAERIFELLSKLKKEEVYTFRDGGGAGDDVWSVNFSGTPSFRHANRIGIFRDFLGALLPGHLETIAGRPGSVVVDFAPEDDTQEYCAASKRLAGDKGAFLDIAALLGITSLSFNGVNLEF